MLSRGRSPIPASRFWSAGVNHAVTQPQERSNMATSAWKVAWTAFVVAVFSWGVAFYGPSVFLQTVHAERGWVISIISLAITTNFLFSAVLVLYLPEAHRRFGIAAVIQAG